MFLFSFSLEEFLCSFLQSVGLVGSLIWSILFLFILASVLSKHLPFGTGIAIISGVVSEFPFLFRLSSFRCLRNWYFASLSISVKSGFIQMLFSIFLPSSQLCSISASSWYFIMTWTKRPTWGSVISILPILLQLRISPFRNLGSILLHMQNTVSFRDLLLVSAVMSFSTMPDNIKFLCLFSSLPYFCPLSSYLS